MEVLGFIFGMFGMTFGLMGMINSMTAMNKIKELEDQIANSPREDTNA